MNSDWQSRRERLRKHLADNPMAGVTEEELQAHFDYMPARYWKSVDETELVWALHCVHRFLHGNVVSANADTAVVIDWRAFPAQGHTKVVVCTWDRVGLLARIAAYISALRLNIVRAEIFTRADNIALDIFSLSNGEQGHDRLRELEFLVQGGLSEPPRFISAWACESHKGIPRASQVAPVVLFNNEDSAEHTIITVEASERLGLLHDILRVLCESRLNIAEAVVNTLDNVAHDIFFVTDEQRSKVTNHQYLKAVEYALLQTLGE